MPPGVKQSIKKIAEITTGQICVIIDREGFGPHIGKVEEYLISNNLTNKVKILAPRSFEYLLLKGIFSNKYNNMLEETYNYCEAKTFNSWEVYYEKLLKEASKEIGVKYDKSFIAVYFLKNRKKVLSQLEISRDLWR